MTNFTDINDVAHTIANEGIAAVPHHRIRAIANEAMYHDASPVLAHLLSDRTQPAVARERAFGRITAAFLTTQRHAALAA